MGLYSDHIFPRFYDRAMDRPFWAKYRQEHLAAVTGEILEIGVGTGLNLPHYPPHVRKITTVDPNPGMNKRLQRRLAEARIEVDTRVLRGESLPFSDASFDCVVSTITLCSIAQREQAVSELFRVLKPGGSLHFLEHGLSPDANVARWQRRLNWLQRNFAAGCSLTVDVRQLLSTQPFQDLQLRTFYMEQTPRTHGYMSLGTATK